MGGGGGHRHSRIWLCLSLALPGPVGECRGERIYLIYQPWGNRDVVGVARVTEPHDIYDSDEIFISALRNNAAVAYQQIVRFARPRYKTRSG